MYPGLHAVSTPDKPAAIRSDTGEVITYAQLEERSTRLARLLNERGVVRGDRVAVVADNSLRYWEIYWAVLRSGLYITAVNSHLTPQEVAYIVNDCGATCLIAAAELAELAEAVVPLTPGVSVRLAFGGRLEGFDSYEEGLDATSPVALDDLRRGADMLYSSGTTGTPKGIKPPLPAISVDEKGDVYTAVFGGTFSFSDSTVYLSTAPLYHAAPLRIGGVVQALGGTVIVMPKFEPLAALELIERYRVTHSQWVPTMFVRLLKLPEEQRRSFDHSSLVCAIHAAAPCPVEVKRQMMNWWGPILWEYYASTEGNGITMVSPQQWLEKPGSVGKAALGIVHVCAEDGTELAPGEIGLVYFERDALPFSYHNDEEKTKAAQHREHPTWTTTGDVGHVDDDGYVFLTDRQAFVVISGGVNLYPQEIENELVLHPDIADIAVIGLKDDEMGERLHAVVQLRPGATGDDSMRQSIIDFGKSRLAGFKVPRSVEFAERLPRSATGKMMKRQVQAQFLGDAVSG